MGLPPVVERNYINSGPRSGGSLLNPNGLGDSLLGDSEDPPEEDSEAPTERVPQEIYLETLKVYVNSDFFGDVMDAVYQTKSITRLIVGRNERMPEERM
jgi:hypothetical protein